MLGLCLGCVWCRPWAPCKHHHALSGHGVVLLQYTRLTSSSLYVQGRCLVLGVASTSHIKRPTVPPRSTDLTAAPDHSHIRTRLCLCASHPTDPNNLPRPAGADEASPVGWLAWPPAATEGTCHGVSIMRRSATSCWSWPRAAATRDLMAAAPAAPVARQGRVGSRLPRSPKAAARSLSM